MTTTNSAGARDITNATQLLQMLARIEGAVTINSGVLSTESGETIDLTKLDDGSIANDLAARLKKAHDLFESSFAELNSALQRGDLSGAQFPRVGHEAQIELVTRQSALLWVLEMLPKPNKTLPQQVVLPDVDETADYQDEGPAPDQDDGPVPGGLVTSPAGDEMPHTPRTSMNFPAAIHENQVGGLDVFRPRNAAFATEVRPQEPKGRHGVISLHGVFTAHQGVGP